MPSATIKLATNIPLIGTVKYMDFYPGKEKDGTKYAAQIALKGTWDEKGDGTVYLAAPVAYGILKDGFAHEDGKKSFQGAEVPQFKWDYQGKVRVLKSEDGLKRHTTVTAADGPVDAATGGPPRKVEFNRPPILPGSTPSPAPATDERWTELGRNYAKAVEIAAQTWQGGNLDSQAIVAAAATVFIEANKRGLTVPKTAEQQAATIRDTVDSFTAMPTQLKEEPDPELPEWMR